MSTKAAAQSEPAPLSGEAAQPRQVSPDISEVLHLIGAMERLIGDVEARHETVAVSQDADLPRLESK